MFAHESRNMFLELEFLTRFTLRHVISDFIPIAEILTYARTEHNTTQKQPSQTAVMYC